MATKFSPRTVTTNSGGIATGYLRVNWFYVVFVDGNDQVQGILHSTEKVSVKKMLESIGVSFEDALVERIN